MANKSNGSASPGNAPAAAGRTRITRADVMPAAEYARQRKEMRAHVTALKRDRRVEVGPYCTFYFESWDTMRHQVHEMLHIEKGGEEQIQGELDAYNTLVPNGAELVATVMFEIDDPVRRANVLARLGGVEETASLQFAGETVKGVPEADQDRTTEAGKASSVQFIHFPFTKAQIEKFKQPGMQVILGLAHPNYGHLAVLPEPVRAALAGDFV
ncbi:MAG: DUF3501 family protein [Alphaproteobacteria bacterium]